MINSNSTLYKGTLAETTYINLYRFNVQFEAILVGYYVKGYNPVLYGKEGIPMKIQLNRFSELFVKSEYVLHENENRQLSIIKLN